MPKEFVLGGDTGPAAALDFARTVVRRAERAVVRLEFEARAEREAEFENPHLFAYLNRLSSLCFVLALWEVQHWGDGSPTLAKG